MRGTTDQDIAATIVGYIRHIMLHEPLVPYEQRVDNAVIKLLESQPWDREQQRWLMRIGKQLKENVIIDRTTFDTGAFSEFGGFPTLNKVFDGKLEDILGGLIDSMWQVAGYLGHSCPRSAIPKNNQTINRTKSQATGRNAHPTNLPP